MSMLKSYKWLFIVFAVFFVACKDTKNDPDPQPSYLTNSVLVNTISQADLKTQIVASFGPEASAASFLIRSGIKQYKISYKTKTITGESITASGAVMVPTDLSTEKLALSCVQHGTLFNEKDAPSYFNPATESTLGSVLASTGFIVGLPDYIGYGDSKDVPHPYEHNKGSSESNVDFIRAVKEFIAKEKLNWNNNLMIGGYSQGGYVTLAMQKLIEEKYASEFNLKASSCGAGAYNKTKTIESFLKNKTSGEASNNRSYIWVLQTYDRIYGLNRNLNTYFIEPYLSQIQKDGHMALISKSFDEILQPSFVTGILNGTDTKFIDAVKDNDIYDWAPKVPTNLYHGDKDTYVPFLNSQTAYDAMVKKGSTSVKLIPISGGTHSSSVFDFFMGTYFLFSANKNL